MDHPPILNPNIPYLGQLEGGFGPGRMIRIVGKSFENSNGFSISLSCASMSGCEELADVGLHLDAQFSKKVVTRNAKSGTAGWGRKKRGGPPFPLERGQQFDITILCSLWVYKIYINGHHFPDFNHRVPAARVNRLIIEGDITISSITIETSHQAEQSFCNPSVNSVTLGQSDLNNPEKSETSTGTTTASGVSSSDDNDRSWRRVGRRTKIGRTSTPFATKRAIVSDNKIDSCDP